MTKKLLHGEEARKEALKGINKVADAVGCTMWPKGRNVLFNNQVIVSTNDGVAVANAITLKNEAESLWAELVKEAANEANRLAWDGTTTTTILTRAIAEEGMRHVGSGVNPFSLARWLDKAKNEVIDQLKKQSTPVKDKVEEVATISSQDPEIGKLISDIIKEVWEDGVITVSESHTPGITKEIVPGMQFSRGYLTQYFINNAKDQTCVLEDVSVVITDQVIKSSKQVGDIINGLYGSGSKNILFIAEDVEQQVLADFVWNTRNSDINILAVKAPQHGENREKMLEDIAALTGGNVISDKTGVTFQSVSLSDIGKADKVTASKFFTTIVGGQGSKEDIKKRVLQIKDNIKTVETEWGKVLLKNRLAAMSGGIAVIKVGAPTDVDTKNKIYKIEDAINATKSALEEGIIQGGGVALAKAKVSALEDEEENLWASILRKAIEAPLAQIAKNAGYKGDYIVEEVRRTGKGFNAKTGEYWDLIKMWVIDPVKVTRIALENAVSAASTFLATECIIINEEKDATN